MLRHNFSSSSAAVAASSRWRWQLMLFGLFYMVMQGDARAVNVSNTWTMPQEGLNVFYRFFRDRISWFEADAVCQFHHANLVTVDNSFQFDATRDLLRELDVNDIVWIGLMRPQSSDRFMWSNSRPLVADTGYWAESLPLMDAPLCAVIDPIRDYRWHALRCGGPETASFLCEMPVPNWADTCILKDMPNLTMQYMADTASIELIRNCQEEGLLRTTCRGKQDRDRAMQDLICPRERLEAQRINDITNSHFKSLQIINSIPSDNNENNDIELLPMEVNYGSSYPEELQTEKNTVQRLIEQFNVDELMQADEPANMETVSSFYKIPGLIPKPVKKSAKKVLEYPKKDVGKKVVLLQDAQKDKTRVALEMDDMMLGDQPHGEPEMPEEILNEEVSNEIMEPLPHIKKTNIHKADMEQMEKKALAIKESMLKLKEIEAKKMAAMTTPTAEVEKTTSASSSTTTTTTTVPPTTTSVSTTIKPELTTTTTKTPPETTTAQVTTTESLKTSSATQKMNSMETATEDASAASSHITTTSTAASATIGHPMHPQQPRSNVIVTEESQHLHVKESPDNSHFIPPMLLVKSHYVPPTNKHVHNDHHSHAEQHSDVATTTNEDLTEMTKTQAGNSEMLMTTPKVIDLDETIKLKDSDSMHNNQQPPTHIQQQPEPEQKQEQEQKSEQKQKQAKAEEQTSENGNMKPITQEDQNNKEPEKRHNSKYMNLDEAIPPAAMTSEAPVTTTMGQKQTNGEGVATTLQTTTTKFVEGNGRPELNDNSNDDGTKEAGADAETTQVDMASEKESTKTTSTTATPTTVAKELKPQTDIETVATEKPTKLVETTARTVTTIKAEVASSSGASALKETAELKHDLVTESTESATSAASATTTAKQMEYVKEAMEKSDLALKQHQKNTEQLTQETHAGFATTTTTSTAHTSEATKSARRLILATDMQATQSTETSGETKDNAQEGGDKEDTNDELDDDKEQFGTTAEVLTTKVTAMTTATTTISPSTTTKAPALTTSTTTTIEHTMERNANTNSSVNSPTSATAGADATSTTTTTASPTPTAAAHANPSENSSIPDHSTSTTIAAESSPETTKNFLKVTTEMPYKPNRRRSLTKPETVSYMKKILG